jgi:hypothetical protein
VTTVTYGRKNKVGQGLAADFSAVAWKPRAGQKGVTGMKHNRERYTVAVPYRGTSLEEIQEGVSAEAVSYAAGLLVEAIRNFETARFSSRQKKLTLTEAQMIAANLIAKSSAQLDEITLEEQLARVRHAIKETKA